MGSAKLESYVENLVSDWVSKVNSSGILTHSIPPSLRAHFFSQQAVVSSYQRFVAYGDESMLNNRIVSFLNSNYAQFLLDGNSLPPLNAGWILYERKYPSPDNWTLLFRRLGIPNIFNVLNAEARTDVEMMLTSFNDLRSALAHEGIPPGLSAQDIRSRISEITKIVAWLDKVLFRSLGTIQGVYVWSA